MMNEELKNKIRAMAKPMAELFSKYPEEIRFTMNWRMEKERDYFKEQYENDESFRRRINRIIEKQ